MQHLVYGIKNPVVSINASLLTIALHSLVRTTLVYNDKNYLVPFMTCNRVCILLISRHSTVPPPPTVFSSF
jgi:hypothetical protein